jgi:hypothetical protein
MPIRMRTQAQFKAPKLAVWMISREQLIPAHEREAARAEHAEGAQPLTCKTLDSASPDLAARTGRLGAMRPSSTNCCPAPTIG